MVEITPQTFLTLGGNLIFEFKQEKSNCVSKQVAKSVHIM